MREQSELKSVKRRLVYEDVLDAIENYIADQKLQTGTRLPSEQEFSERLGVGSRSVREALKSLQTRGVVEIHHGKGVFVANNQMNTFLTEISKSIGLLLREDRDLLFEVVLVRRMIEGELTGVAALARSDKQIKVLRKLLTSQRAAMEAGKVEEYNALDVEFHEEIVHIAGYRIIEALYRQFYGTLTKTFHRTGYIPGSLATSYREHEIILRCVENRDAQTARVVVEKHINRTLHDLEAFSTKGSGGDE